MSIGIMQPYFFPYLGYISLIKHTDRFILFDPVQFIRHGWIERNRILKPSDGWQYIQVPLIKSDGRATLIKDIRINNRDNWKLKIAAQLQHYKKKAPYYNVVMDLLDDVFSFEYEDITSLNKKALQAVCSYLGIKRELEVYSHMNLSIDEVNAPDEWALNICKALGIVDEYVNPIGGLSFFDVEKYHNAGINIKFIKSDLPEYNQKRERFEEGLSILDVMMWNSPEQTNDMLDKITYITA